MSNKVLGLDLSTTTVGFAFAEDQKILEAGFIDISKQKILRDKIFLVFEMLSNNDHFDDLDVIYIEESLQNFAYGRTSTQTIIKLSQINAVMSFVMEESSGVDVKKVNVNTARKRVFGKSRQKGKAVKEFVREQLESKYNLSEWYKITSRGNWDKRNSDTLDSIVIALFGVSNEQSNN